jgi:DNA repair exonuclease SbcCD ATPase subunit
MRINKIQFKNIKSFGNNLEEISFSDTGELILLTGKNGAGKSTIQEVIDLTIFGQIRGKNTKKIPLKYISNRFNKNLYTKVNFLNFNNDVIEIERQLNPTNFKILKNDFNITKEFKNYSDVELENILDFNYLTFKSFISLSMNDFLNFINLETEQKKLLINKLFNLEKIDNYLNITKELKTQTQKEYNNVKLTINNNNSTLKEYKSIIKNILENQNNNKNIQISKLKEQYTKLINNKKIIKENNNLNNNNINSIDLEIELLTNNNSNLDSENIQRRTELNNINDKIKLYDNDKCPYCENDLLSNKETILQKLILNKNETLDLITKNNKLININKDNLIILNINKSKLLKIKSKHNNELIQINIDISNLKEQSNKLNENNTELSVKELKEKGKKLSIDNQNLNNKLIQLQNKIDKYNKLIEVFNENGIRKNIIKEVIIPINNNLQDFINKINFEYNVKLNDEFDAIIYERYNEVYSEIVSNGEQKIINILIALSYLKFILKIRDINILFLDEIFNSIHEDNIDLILILLKEISKEFNINIFVIHHGINHVNLNHFNKIIKLKKSFFSEMKIEEVIV